MQLFSGFCTSLDWVQINVEGTLMIVLEINCSLGWKVKMNVKTRSSFQTNLVEDSEENQIHPIKRLKTNIIVKTKEKKLHIWEVF